MVDYGIGQIQLAGNCKKCKKTHMINLEYDNKKSYSKQLVDSLCESCYEEFKIINVTTQRDSKLDLLLKSKKKWYQFWKD